MRLISLCTAWLDRVRGDARGDDVSIGSQAPKGGKAIALLFLLAAVASLAGCGKADPDAELRVTIAAMQQAMGSRDAGALFAPFADDFIGTGSNLGPLDRAGIERLARLQFLRNASVDAKIGPLEIVRSEDRARVEFTVLLTAGAGGWLPERGQLYAVQTGWRYQDAEWRLISAEWKPQL